jgi:hypothetical protein
LCWGSSFLFVPLVVVAVAFNDAPYPADRLDGLQRWIGLLQTTTCAAHSRRRRVAAQHRHQQSGAFATLLSGVGWVPVNAFLLERFESLAKCGGAIAMLLVTCVIPAFPSALPAALPTSPTRLSLELEFTVCRW